jgi:hypothetical protein
MRTVKILAKLLHSGKMGARTSFKQGVLLCAFTLTTYIQFSLIFLFGLFFRPFGVQKPSLVVNHGI